ncbi:hypothetical protein CONLIGDRAFT_275751 [Coniochaeta ligniaria NRRL 30616]|uniref:Uncharacterized protein n=1 Tax=Coniochaeta ligniaria NRRL 30616 TaxID=1408157 RepID=A0A1J7IZT3_9PEZI|nr:hypothetical protein CONLIGDRAFT_275751 [Coniochaeta ligniaria NRRL 30616]
MPPVVVVVQAEGRGIRCSRRQPMTRQRPPPLRPLAPLQGSSQPPSLTVSIYPTLCKPVFAHFNSLGISARPSEVIGLRYIVPNTMHCVHANDINSMRTFSLSTAHTGVCRSGLSHWIIWPCLRLYQPMGWVSLDVSGCCYHAFSMELPVIEATACSASHGNSLHDA